MAALRINDKQPLIVNSFITKLGAGALPSRNDTVNLAGKRFAQSTVKLQEILIQQLIKMDVVSSAHGAIGDVISFVKERVHLITKMVQPSEVKYTFNRVFHDYHERGVYSKFIFKLPESNSTFIGDSGYYGVLIYQVHNGEIENVFQCDWDVEKPYESDRWLSLIFGSGLLTAETLRLYLRGHKSVKLIASVERFKKIFYKDLTGRLVGNVPEILKDTLNFQAQGLGLASHSHSRLSELAEHAMSSVYNKANLYYPLEKIFDAIHQMHRDEAPFMTEAAFFEQWENKEKFDRLDSILYGYKPSALGYIIKLKDQNKYVFIEVTNDTHITMVSVLGDEHQMYLNLPRWNVEDIEFSEALEGKLEFEGFVEHA